jgi:hypothetical protein
MDETALVDGSGALIGRVTVLRETEQGTIYRWRVSTPGLYRVRKKTGETIGHTEAIRAAVTAAASLSIKGAAVRR